MDLGRIYSYIYGFGANSFVYLWILQIHSSIYACWLNSFVNLLNWREFMRISMDLGEFIPIFKDLGRVIINLERIHSCIYGFGVNSFVYL